MESVLIFGGGDNQRTLIQSAKELGYRTIVIDPNPEAPAKNEAHYFEVIAAKDKEATIAIANKYDIKGIVTCQMENPLLLMAEVAEELGLIFPSKHSIQKARDKWLMKQAFILNSVPCAKAILIRKTEEIPVNEINVLRFPLIIKPLDAFSSRGVYKVFNISEIRKYLDKTQQFSSNGDIIIEEFLGGPEVSVESITYKGVTEVIQITDKLITPEPNTVEMTHIQPTNHNPNVKQQIIALVKNAITALSLDNCATHAELKITEKGIKMIEIGARLGGDYISSYLVSLSTGINLEAAAIQVSLGKKPDLIHQFSKGSTIQYLNLQTGRKILRIHDWKYIFNEPDVKHAMLFARENEIVPEITDSSKRMGFVIVQSTTRDESVIKARLLANELEAKIEYN